MYTKVQCVRNSGAGDYVSVCVSVLQEHRGGVKLMWCQLSVDFVKESRRILYSAWVSRGDKVVTEGLREEERMTIIVHLMMLHLQMKSLLSRELEMLTIYCQ